MRPPAKRQLIIPTSLSDALDTFERFGRDAEFFAGGTWIMRADIRQEFETRMYISLGALDELKRIAVTNDEVSIGASVTHSEVAAAVASIPEHRALFLAASKSANPAIRDMATIGGSICTLHFAAADLVPALLCLSACVEVFSRTGIRKMELNEFLRLRAELPGIVTRLVVPRASRRSSHVRLPLKKAGDYPAAIVSASVTLGSDATVENPVIAVGSVETTARRWRSLEAMVAGKPLQPDAIAKVTAQCLGELQARDGVEAPGWYRLRVLPELVRRAFQDLID